MAFVEATSMSHPISSGYRVALLTCGFLIGGTSHIVAQVSEPRLQGGVGMVAVAPVGEFKTFVPNGAGGFLGHLDVRLGNSIFS